MNVNSNRMLFADKNVKLSAIELNTRMWVLPADVKCAGYNKVVITVTSISGLGSSQTIKPYGAAGTSGFFQLPLFKMHSTGAYEVETIDRAGTYIVYLGNVGYWNLMNTNAIEGSVISIDYVMKYDSDSDGPLRLLKGIKTEVESINSIVNVKTKYSGTVDMSSSKYFVDLIDIDKQFQTAVVYLKYNHTEETRKNLSVTGGSRGVPITCYDNNGNIYKNINYLAFEESQQNIFYFNIAGLDKFYLQSNKVDGATLEYVVTLCSESVEHLARIKPNQKIFENRFVSTGSETSFGGAVDFEVYTHFFKYFKVIVRLQAEGGGGYYTDFRIETLDNYLVNTYKNPADTKTVATATGTDRLSTDLIETGAYGRRFYIRFNSKLPEGTKIDCVIYGVR